LRWVHERYTESTLYGATSAGDAVMSVSAEPQLATDVAAEVEPSEAALIADDTPPAADRLKPS